MPSKLLKSHGPLRSMDRGLRLKRTLAAVGLAAYKAMKI
jgi:hypothetical protein